MVWPAGMLTHSPTNPPHHARRGEGQKRLFVSVCMCVRVCVFVFVPYRAYMCVCVFAEGQKLHVEQVPLNDYGQQQVQRH